jgi:S-formylglutathione hydrolase FrmB
MFRAAAAFSGITDTLLNPDESRGYQGLVSNEGADPADLWGDPATNIQTWKAHNPYDLAPKLRGVQLYVSAGSGNPGPGDTDPQLARLERSLRAENDAFAQRLRALGLTATVHLYDPGIHDWPYWQRELHRAWPILTGAIGATRA